MAYLLCLVYELCNARKTCTHQAVLAHLASKTTKSVLCLIITYDLICRFSRRSMFDDQQHHSCSELQVTAHLTRSPEERQEGCAAPTINLLT
jgi:hypothetical protein